MSESVEGDFKPVIETIEKEHAAAKASLEEKVSKAKEKATASLS